MKQISIKNSKLARPEGPPADAVVQIGDGIIRSISREQPVSEESVLDASGAILFPGFIDVHIHGAVGFDVNTATADELLEVAGFLARNGITAWVPTLVPDSDENYRRAVGEIGRLMEIQQGKAVAQAVGVHYEGVFANERMCGALRPEYFKKFTGNEVRELPRVEGGVHMTTFAPEVEGGIELVRELVREGWIPSIGHTRADADTLELAFAAGARHMTHFFNAMTGIHHRDVGVAGWALTNEDVTFDIIADGLHVNPRMLEFACRAKSADKVTLISDSVAPTGLGDGVFELWNETVTVKKGLTQNERGSIAGSVITMHDAVRRMLSLGFSAEETARMASTNPARLLGLSASRGSIEPGKRADLVGLDADGSIKFVMIGGEQVDLG